MAAASDVDSNRTSLDSARDVRPIAYQALLRNSLESPVDHLRRTKGQRKIVQLSGVE
jgi:hypothetical protein